MASESEEGEGLLPRAPSEAVGPRDEKISVDPVDPYQAAAPLPVEEGGEQRLKAAPPLQMAPTGLIQGDQVQDRLEPGLGASLLPGLIPGFSPSLWARRARVRVRQG
ncbi:hypothetical protein TJA_19430 [Thermus sp. LT1-2-5]